MNPGRFTPSATAPKLGPVPLRSPTVTIGVCDVSMLSQLVTRSPMVGMLVEESLTSVQADPTTRL